MTRMAETLPIDPEKELFRWGPTPLVSTYAGTFFQAFQRKHLEAYSGIYWRDALWLVHKDQFVFVEDAKELQESGANVFRTKILTDEYERHKRDTAARLQLVYGYYNKLSPNWLSELSDEDFVKETEVFDRLLLDYIVATVPAELGNYGSISVLEAELKKVVAPDGVPELVRILTSSDKIGFYQQEEIDLQETDDVETHRNTYFWLKNSYGHLEDLPTSFFEDHKKELLPTLRADIEHRIQRVQAEKRAAITQYNVPEQTVFIAERIVDAMEFQDERKKEILISLHYINMFLGEFRRRNVAEHPDRYILPELVELMRGTRTDDRGEVFGYILIDGVISYIDEKRAEEYWHLYANEHVKESVTEFTGIVASKAPSLTATARIVLNAHGPEAAAFEKGEVLVTTMTSPEFVFLMKKAGAIVTDTGGLTSHAAIVSRELKKPCIIGTKVASQVLKDGDMVEVDAEKGIVRKI